MADSNQIVCHKCGNSLRVKKAENGEVRIMPCMDCAEYFADMIDEPAEFRVLDTEEMECSGFSAGGRIWDSPCYGNYWKRHGIWT